MRAQYVEVKKKKVSAVVDSTKLSCQVKEVMNHNEKV